jgi:hypothetical protein
MAHGLRTSDIPPSAGKLLGQPEYTIAYQFDGDLRRESLERQHCNDAPGPVLYSSDVPFVHLRYVFIGGNSINSDANSRELIAKTILVKLPI